MVTFNAAVGFAAVVEEKRAAIRDGFRVDDATARWLVRRLDVMTDDSGLAEFMARPSILDKEGD